MAAPDTLQQQGVRGPLLNPVEMANASVDGRRTQARAVVPHRAQFRAVVRRAACSPDPQLLVSEAMFAIARYQVEDFRHSIRTTASTIAGSSPARGGARA
ncbi:hypothetical protein [Burkholderia ambifaria]|uniref:hypothetical protein n=1 Tax=Burkholderia ambifaria TaxID=152480 RepID=UPI003981C4AE